MLFITVQPDGSIEEVEVADGQETYPILSGAVKGYIEPVHYSADLEHYHNEEYLYAEGEVFQQINLTVALLKPGAIVYGPVIFTGGVDDEGETRGLSALHARRIKEKAVNVRQNLDAYRAQVADWPKPEPVVTVTAW